MKRLFALISLVACVLVLNSPKAFAASQAFAWTVPTDLTGIAGYQLRWGTSSGSYTSSTYISGSSSTTGTATTLTPGTTYYVVVRSCGSSACTVASANSNEVILNSATFAAPTALHTVSN